jgi:tRNA (cytosine49-C5)-methyltransferase
MNTPEKIEKKRQLLLERTAEALNVDVSDAEKLFSIVRRSSFRINRLKITDTNALLSELSILGWKGEQSSFYTDGYSIIEGRNELVNSAAFNDGRIFIQNQASWLPVIALDPQPNERILDICAAPGGKASHIAELTNNEAGLTVNDNSRQRLFKLKANFERLGAQYLQQTMYGIERLARSFPEESFDKILLDAPCSGEGLMNISKAKDFEYWSTAQIKRLQQLQKRAITSAWQLLKLGGTLVYSTCTMAPEENELVVDYLMQRNNDATVVPIDTQLPNRYAALNSWHDKAIKSDLSGCIRLAPSEDLEAFFVAKLIKS